MKKKVMVSGACGKMGQEVVKTIVEDQNNDLVGVVDVKNVGQDIYEIIGLAQEKQCLIENNLEKAIKKTNPDVIIDFTSPKVVMDNIKTGLNNQVHMIVGTTGITETDQKTINKLTKKNKVNALIVPNFAIGAVLLMKFSAEAAKYMDDVEIIELHHNQKIDAPSGTSLKTAELINNNNDFNKYNIEEIEKLEGARGGTKNGIHIHSVRLPGLVAHQEVIFGGEGQSLTLRHDSFDRKSFMPGVRMALDKIDIISGMIYGLEKIM
jgi:4-hydroxy-tetrahydrodipicolinate reductase